LDELLSYARDWEGVKNFLTMVAYRHARKALPKLEQDFDVKEFEDYLCSEIFTDARAYFEVVRASEGNPRDFLKILALCCGNLITPGKQRKADSARSISIAANYFADTKAEPLENDPQIMSLYERIFKRVVRTKCKAFLTSKEFERDPRMLELWHYRFIHVVNSAFATLDENENAQTYTVYSIDYGKLLTLKIDEQGDTLVNKAVEFFEAMATLNNRILGGIGNRLADALQNETTRDPLRKIAGTFSVSLTGVEKEKLNSTFLTKNCVIDDLLIDDPLTEPASEEPTSKKPTSKKPTSKKPTSR
jgi:hypothetical protein